MVSSSESSYATNTAIGLILMQNVGFWIHIHLAKKFSSMYSFKGTMKFDACSDVLIFESMYFIYLLKFACCNVFICKFSKQTFSWRILFFLDMLNTSKHLAFIDIFFYFRSTSFVCSSFLYNQIVGILVMMEIQFQKTITNGQLILSK